MDQTLIAYLQHLQTSGGLVEPGSSLCSGSIFLAVVDCPSWVGSLCGHVHQGKPWRQQAMGSVLGLACLACLAGTHVRPCSTARFADTSTAANSARLGSIILHTANFTHLRWLGLYLSACWSAVAISPALLSDCRAVCRVPCRAIQFSRPPLSACVCGSQERENETTTKCASARRPA